MSSRSAPALAPSVLRWLQRCDASPDAAPDLETWQRLLKDLPDDATARAERVEEAVFRNLSHELRTPMTAIMGTLQFLSEAGLSREHHKLVETAYHAGLALVGMIDDLLDYARIEAGELELLDRDFELCGMLEQLCQSFRPAAAERGLVLSTQFVGGTPRRLRGDAMRLRQVLHNLLANAIKFTEHGSIGIRVTLNHADAKGASLCFTVSDTGIGLAREAIDLLFQPFGKLNISLKHRARGTGVGLAIARRLISLMGGTMGVDSSPGHGSSFWFVVPFKWADARSAARSIAPRTDAIAGERCRVLIVEDDAVSRAVTARTLEGLDLDIAAAQTGVEALAMLAQKPFDLVLMDCQMPELDGYTTARTIRSLDTGVRYVPILALTANALAGDREKCLDAGMNDYLKKPFDLDELRNKVLGWLGRDGLGVAPSEPPSQGPSSSAVEDTAIVRLDLSRLEELAEQAGDFSIVVELSQIFLQDIESRMTTIRRAIADANLLEIQRAAHTVKGAAGNFGALRLAAQAAALELADELGPAVEQGFRQVLEEFERVRAMLANRVLSGSASTAQNSESDAAPPAAPI